MLKKMVFNFETEETSKAVSTCAKTELVELDPAEGYEPALDDLISLETDTKKHKKHDTANTKLEIEGILISYDAEAKAAVLATRCVAVQNYVGVTIAADTERKFKRDCRILGIDLF